MGFVNKCSINAFSCYYNVSSSHKLHNKRKETWPIKRNNVCVQQFILVFFTDKRESKCVYIFVLSKCAGLSWITVKINVNQLKDRAL